MLELPFLEDLYEKNQICRLCDHEFKSMQVRRSKQIAADTESDFYIKYKREIPYYYRVFVCPACGFAFLESYKKVPDKRREELKLRIRKLPDFFSGQRNASTAELAYKQALECARLQNESDAVLASLNLHLSWIHRDNRNEDKERSAQEEALKHYTNVYEKSDLSDTAKVTYLIGELHRRLGSRKEAVFWYSKVINDDHTNIGMRRMAREAWQSLRD